ncbi:glycosyltransferase family 61 protein [Microlunatus parietis]|uniref:Capsular polysaccharide biosynthesis protein n=1 Tax=Microlunatus parietis TaxID=682979 RepID=A0A7Y9LGU5_9ACTN|nr:glycosyltransferase family 61 protein [Microlunatus parietis]NYE75601.1 capsular polysaccharide biosynthesis protein [Microlunatus parietis]
MDTSRPSEQPRRVARLKKLGRRYAPDWLKSAYRSARGEAARSGNGTPAKAGNGTTQTKAGNGTQTKAGSVPWVDVAQDRGWTPDKPTRAFLARLEEALPQGRTNRIALFTDDTSAELTALLVQVLPNSSVFAVADGTDSDQHAELTAQGPLDVIIDATLAAPAERLRRFRRTLFHLRAGGRYCVRSAAAGLTADAKKTPSIWEFVSRVTDDRDRGRFSDVEDKKPTPRKDEKGIAEAVRGISYDDALLIITSAGPALPKLREWEVERVLAAKPEIGRILTRLPATTFSRVGDLRYNHDRHDPRFATEYKVPELQLREYDDALACPHQVVLSHDVILPDTFRHLTHPRLKNRFLDDLNPLFARYPRKVSEPKELSGSYFYLSSEWPRHFGHMMTEQLSRMWAWSAAKERHPDLKVLLPLPGGHNELAPFEREVLMAAGAGPDDFVSPKGVLRVEKLLSATPMLVNPSYVHPELPDVWRRAGAKLVAEGRARSEQDRPAKVFVSRRSNYKRACHNLTEVEEFFTRHGFTIVYPEDYDVAEQATIFDSAELIAGFAGSAMFSLIFCAEPKRVILISSESYTARNEYMMAFAMGHRVSLVWCDPDIAQPEKGWDGKAFASGFSVDFERDGDFLTDAATTDW